MNEHLDAAFDCFEVEETPTGNFGNDEIIWMQPLGNLSLQSCIFAVRIIDCFEVEDPQNNIHFRYWHRSINPKKLIEV